MRLEVGGIVFDLVGHWMRTTQQWLRMPHQMLHLMAEDKIMSGEHYITVKDEDSVGMMFVVAGDIVHVYLM
jgi:hypothetical protein